MPTPVERLRTDSPLAGAVAGGAVAAVVLTVGRTLGVAVPTVLAGAAAACWFVVVGAAVARTLEARATEREELSYDEADLEAAGPDEAGPEPDADGPEPDADGDEATPASAAARDEGDEEDARGESELAAEGRESAADRGERESGDD